ncbi:hypothetical protein BH10PSE17_BH10PSE17_23540 [soil metagenome]
MRRSVKSQAPTFTRIGARLVYEEHGTVTALRIVAVVFGLGAIAASAIFFEIVASMGELASAAKIGGAVASLLAVAAFWAFGGYCLWLGLFVPRQKIVFDGGARRFEYFATAPARSGRPTLHAFDDVTEAAVLEQRFEDSPTTFAITLKMTAGRRFLLGGFADREAAERQRLQIVELLEPPGA